MTKAVVSPDRLNATDLIEVAPFLDGKPVASSAGETFAAFDPNSGAKLTDIPVGSAADADKAVASARRSYANGSWRHQAPSARKAILCKWADLIARHATRLDAFDALEMGKPVSTQAFNAASAALFVRFNAEALDKCEGTVLSSDRFSTVLQKKVPRGVVAAVVPWNFPTYNIVLKVAPALAAGNSVVLKPSELVSQSALILATLAVEAGIPPGVLNVVPGRGETVGRALAEHMDVDMVTFTGSTAVGKLMLQYAGRSNMKVVSAECGGKSPQIVFNDGLDLDMVARAVAGMILTNQGQICSVGSRLLVHESIQEPFVRKVVQHLQGTVTGDPQLPSTTFGPLASQAQLDRVLAYVSTGEKDGANLIHGGVRVLENTGGYFMQPTVFANVPENAKIAQEEIFGPVLSVMSFRDADDAIRLANSTAYGLAAYIWTSQMATGLQLGNAISTALTLVNATQPTGEGCGMSYSGEPFGLSGVGTEGGMAGLETYMRRQTLWLNHG